MNKILKYILMGLFILLLLISLIKFVLIYIFIYFSAGPKNPSLYRHLKDSVIIFFKSIKYDMINLIDYIK
jgi:hypothetical protein